MYECSSLLAAYLISVSRECPKIAASTTAKHAAPKKRDFCLCLSGEDLEMFPVCTEMVGSRAAAPFDEERISLISAKVSVSLTSEVFDSCLESFLHDCRFSCDLQ